MVDQRYAGDGAEENCCVCGKNTGAVLHLQTVCECRQCGSAVAHNYGGGSCGVASGTCSATVSGAGCYSSASSGCDCALLTTL